MLLIFSAQKTTEKHLIGMTGITNDKTKLFEDILRNPQNYLRTNAYEFISKGLLTKEELVDKYHIISDSAYEHILKYPRLIDEQASLPVCKKNPERDLIDGDVDVLFWGVSGSGGKTSLMSSLMTLVNEKNKFVYRHSQRVKNEYGHHLSNYLINNRIPPATDTNYIQVVNTLLSCPQTQYGVSFIEFAGAQVAHIASNTTKEGLTEGYINPCLGKILKSSNKKILFFCFDPTNLKEIQIGTDSNWWVSQPDLLSCVVSLMRKDAQFMKKVIGIHLIISKSDIWLKKSLEESLKHIINEGNCGNFFLQIEELCKVYRLNKHLDFKVHPIPFSIGKFMFGNTYEYNCADAIKVLDVIKSDLVSYYASRKNSWMSKLYNNLK